MHQQTAAHLARVHQEDEKKKKAHQAEEAKKPHERARGKRQPSPEVQVHPRIVALDLMALQTESTECPSFVHLIFSAESHGPVRK
jgi:hypothetical protein